MITLKICAHDKQMLFKADFNRFLSFGSEWQAIKSSSTWPYINIKAKKKKETAHLYKAK